MTSRFAQSFPCLNGPKAGDYVDAPPGCEVGSAVALPWFNAQHILHYPVYVLTEVPAPEDAPDYQTGDTVKGLMFMQLHHTPEQAQAHVHRLTTVITAAKMANAN